MKTVMIAAALMGLIGAGTCGGGEEAAAPGADTDQKEQAESTVDPRFAPKSIRKTNQDLRDLRDGVQQKADVRARKLDSAAGQ